MENSGYVFNWQRQFIITDHIKHKNGFTLYKVTSVVSLANNVLINEIKFSNFGRYLI